MSPAHRPIPALLAGSALAIGLLGGCGGSSNKAPSGTVSAESYVGQVCTSVANWYRGLQEHTATLNHKLGPGAAPAQDKRALEAFVDVSVADTDRVTSALRGAGVPSVANGTKISRALLAAFERAGSTLKSLEPKVSGVPANDANAVRAEAKRVTEAVQAIPLDLGSGLSGLTSSELDRAAAQSPACKSVGARPKS